MPSGLARVASTARVCGCSPRRPGRSGLRPAARWAIAIASAAAVASSSSEALAICSAVRSPISVWKFSSASSRPCAISAWYGVYAVYQAGFSSTLRRITGGVMVP